MPPRRPRSVSLVRSFGWFLLGFLWLQFGIILFRWCSPYLRRWGSDLLSRILGGSV